MPSQDWRALATELSVALGTDIPPIAITFAETVPQGILAFDEPMPAPNPTDGRTGRVSAGCVFWMKSTQRTFSTVAEDHANCSIGSLTHGFKTLDEVTGNSDVAALLESNWVTMDVVPMIPVVKEKPGVVVYGPLADSLIDPDVVLLRVTGRQLMLLSDALPGLRIEGKPQCHIIAAAKEQDEVVASVGCQLSRVRTGMSNAEMTCAIPASRLTEVIAKLKATARADNAVARYAAEDASRFRI